MKLHNAFAHYEIVESLLLESY